MAAKGTIAKTNVENKIKEIFGADFAGVADKKLYVWADDGGERVQIAIAMTCPKVNVDFGDSASGSAEADPTIGIVGSYVGKRATTIEPIIEMTPEEQATITALLDRFGL